MNEDEEITAEQAFTNVWAYLGYPTNIYTWNDGVSSRHQRAFHFYEGNFNNQDLIIAKEYWDSLPDTFYKGKWGPNGQYEDLQKTLCFRCSSSMIKLTIDFFSLR